MAEIAAMETYDDRYVAAGGPTAAPAHVRQSLLLTLFNVRCRTSGPTRTIGQRPAALHTRTLNGARLQAASY